MSKETNLLLKNKSLLSFLLVRSMIFLSTQMTAVAVGWQIYALTGSAFFLGLVGLVQFIPMVLLTPVVGYTADYFNRKVIICICGTVGGAALLVLAAESMMGSVSKEMIFIVIFFIGIAYAFQGPCVQSLLPNIVDKESFPYAAALAASSVQAATIVGPALGGILYGLGPQVVYGVSAVCFLLSVVFTLTIKITHRAVERQPVTIRSLLAGVSFIKNRPLILGSISLDLFAVLFGGATALLPVYADKILFVGPFGLGLLRSAPAVGALLMSFVLAKRPMTRHVGRNMFAAVTVFGLATVVFAVSRSIALSLVCLFVLGAADVVSVVVRSTLVQMGTPDSMRGRVNSVNQLFIGTSNQLGEFESGVTATLFGPVLAVLIGGIGTVVVVALWIKIFPKLAHINSFGEMEDPGQ